MSQVQPPRPPPEGGPGTKERLGLCTSCIRAAAPPEGGPGNRREQHVEEAGATQGDAARCARPGLNSEEMQETPPPKTRCFYFPVFSLPWVIIIKIFHLTWKKWETMKIASFSSLSYPIISASTKSKI